MGSFAASVAACAVLSSALAACGSGAAGASGDRETGTPDSSLRDVEGSVLVEAGEDADAPLGDTGALLDATLDGGTRDAALDDGPIGDSGTADGEAGSIANDGDGNLGTARFRVVQTSPSSSGCSYDFSWGEGASTSNGPVMKGWGIAAGLAFGEMSDYVTVPAGVHVVVSIEGAFGCTNGSIPYANFIAQAGDSWTVVPAFGGTPSAPTASAFTALEEHDAPADQARIRPMNVDRIDLGGPPSPVDFYLGPQATESLLVAGVAFGNVPAASSLVDSNGYLLHTPLASEPIAIRVPGPSLIPRASGSLSASAGHVYTVFATGPGASSGIEKLLLCDDAAPVTNHVASCSVL